MKCFTRYMLPLVIALCMFLSCSSFSIRAEAEETNTETVDYSACITECKQLADFIEKNFGDSFYYLGSYSDGYGIGLIVSSTPIYFSGQNGASISLSGINASCFKLRSDFSYIANTINFSDSYSVSLFFDASTAFSNHDILHKDTGELFFHQPSPFQTAVRAQDWTTVMMEIVMILPLLIVSLTFLIGLRKGLRHILSFLRQA